MASRAQDYKAKLDALTEQALTLPAEARRAVFSQLEQAAREVKAALVGVDPSSLAASRLQAMKAEIQRIMQSFAQNASSEVGKIEQRMYTDAARSVDATVAAGYGYVPVQPVIDTRTIAIAQGYTADLITGLSHETATQINGALQRAVLGQNTLTQLVAQIGGALEGGTFSGVFGPAGDRSMSIATNEVMRVHSVASFTRIVDLGKRHDGLGKEWLHIPAARVPRVAHVLASGQVRAPNEPFLVGGEELMYPRDPSGSAANTIYCHCLVRPKVSAAQLKPSDREREYLNKLGISVTTA